MGVSKCIFRRTHMVQWQKCGIRCVYGRRIYFFVFNSLFFTQIFTTFAACCKIFYHTCIAGHIIKHMKKGFLLAALLFVISIAAISAQGKDKGVYIFGVSTSFGDSIAYITEVQYLKDVQMEERGDKLPAVQMYSYQLKDYMSQQGQPGRISAIYYATTEKKARKQEAKLRKHLQTRRNMAIRFLGTAFTFRKD